MDPIEADMLSYFGRRLDPVLNTLMSIKQDMECTGAPFLIEPYFGILVAFEKITEAKGQLLKIAEEQEKRKKLKKH